MGLFDLASYNLYRLQFETDPNALISGMAVGLQQICGGVENTLKNPDPIFQTAVQNFYQASIAHSQQDALVGIVVGLLQFGGGLKNTLQPSGK